MKNNSTPYRIRLTHHGYLIEREAPTLRQARTIAARFRLDHPALPESSLEIDNPTEPAFLVRWVYGAAITPPWWRVERDTTHRLEGGRT